MSTHFNRQTLPPVLARYQDWPDADISDLTDEERSRFSRLRTALMVYLNGARITPFLKQLQVSHSELLRILNRCVMPGADGRLWGWGALLRYRCHAGYCRTKPIAGTGMAGALQQLFARHSDIRDRLTALVLRQSPGINEPRIASKAVHRAFLAECAQAGLGPDDWPFRSRWQGRRAIERFVHQVLEQHLELGVRARDGEKAASRLRTGTGAGRLCLAFAPYDVAEMDSHVTDVIGVVGLPTAYGVTWIPIKRLQLLLIVDQFSTAILGSAVVIRRACEHDDLFEAAQDLVAAWQPRTLCMAGMAYPDGGGLPSGLIPGLDSCGISALIVDNALINYSLEAVKRLTGRLGCAINWGPVRRWERRPLVERIFAALATLGLHCVVSTMGSGPEDPRKRDPVGAAVKHRVHLDAILDLIDTLIAHYNLDSSEGRFGLSRLDILRQAANGNGAPWLLPRLPLPTSLQPDFDVSLVAATIAGNSHNGQRPFIKYQRARYTNPTLAASPHLIGRKAVLHVPRRDIRVLDAFLDTGQALGAVIVCGAWAKRPHSLEDRRLINAGIDDGRIVRQHDEDPVTAFHRSLAEEALRKHKLKHPKVSAPATILANSLLQARDAEPGVLNAPGPSVPSRPVVVSRRAPKFDGSLRSRR